MDQRNKDIKPLTLEELVGIERILNRVGKCFESFDCRHQETLSDEKKYRSQIIEPIREVFNGLMDSLRQGDQLTFSGARGELAIRAAKILCCADDYLNKSTSERAHQVTYATGFFRECLLCNVAEIKIKESVVRRYHNAQQQMLFSRLKGAFSRDLNKHRLIPDQGSLSMAGTMEKPTQGIERFSPRP